MFSHRLDAGKQLMDLVSQYAHEIELVLAIPRGGVEVAAVIAQQLQKPLGLISARRVSAPHNPEIAIGAVAPDGTAWFNEELIAHYRLNPEQVEDLRSQAVSEIERQRNVYGQEADLDRIAGRGVLIVDDGAATGATLQACVAALRNAQAQPIGAAVPVASIEVVSILEDSTDYFLALETPTDFTAVSQFYQDFGDVSDQRVQQLLNETSGVQPS